MTNQQREREARGGGAHMRGRMQDHGRSNGRSNDITVSGERGTASPYVQGYDYMVLVLVDEPKHPCPYDSNVVSLSNNLCLNCLGSRNVLIVVFYWPLVAAANTVFR